LKFSINVSVECDKYMYYGLKANLRLYYFAIYICFTCTFEVVDDIECQVIQTVL